jgi:glycosyltransferase involved in cell wall biosynthesis
LNNKKENDLISIIIPVYNTSKYIDKCLTSILNQTYNNLEIIIIDDGSTDNSKEIINKYQTIDNRIIYYHQENSGVAKARNIGLKLLKGNYFVFIDSDDYIDKTFIEKLYNSIDNNILMTICGTVRVNSNNKTFNYVDKKLLNCLRGTASYKRMINKKIFNNYNITFPNLKVCEDLVFYSNLMLVSDFNYKIVDECLYYYVERKDSLMHTYTNIQDDAVKALNIIINYSKKINKYDKYKDILEYAFITNILCGYLKRKILSEISKEELITLYNNLSTLFPNWSSNKYLNENGYIPKSYYDYINCLKNNDFNNLIVIVKNNKL